MQRWQDKAYNSDTDTEVVEPAQKTAIKNTAATHVPAWANASGETLPTDLQAKLTINQPGDVYEQAMRMTAPVDSPEVPPRLATSVSHVSPMIQRLTAEENTPSSMVAENAPTLDTSAGESTQTPDRSAKQSISSSVTPSESPKPGLIVNDTADQLQPGQMKKNDFLVLLRDAVCTTTEEALKGTIWSAASCPWVDHWFGYYGNRDSQQIECAIRRYATETANATSASGYIPIICERVGRAIAVWSTTGEITSVPESIELPGAGLTGMARDAVSGVASVASGGANAGTDLVKNVGSPLSGTDSMLFKGREGRAKVVGNPQAIQGQLGLGLPLNGGVKSRMEGAFGMDFSHVRMHTDARAEGLSNSLNARAFTVGEHVAFGPGEYQPSSLIGDALIAHELAHVVQQRGVNQDQSAQQSDTSYNSLEEDADMSAVGAVASLWSGAKGMLANIAQDALPNLRSGLRLQRCTSRAEKLQKIQNAKELHNSLDSLKDADLDELQKDAPADSLLSKGILWEKAFRKKDWASLAKYSQIDKEGFYEVYNYQIVDQIMAGQTTIKVESSFADWVRGQFIELVSKPVGFRLVIELLATGQTVNITKTTGEQTAERIFSEQNPDAGRFITTDAEGKPLPLAQQRRGRPTGSNIAFNPTLVENQVTLGKTDENLSIIKSEPAVTFGHELIHALHNARGENIAPPQTAEIAHKVLGSEAYYIREPVTGRAESAEELRTTTGQTSFQAPSSVKGPINWALEYNLSSQDNITENMLRSERNLPERVSHTGATRAYQVKVLISETVDQMLSRYYMKDGSAVPDQIRIVLKEVFREFNAFFKERDSVPPEMQKQLKEMTLDFPHEQYLAIYLAHIKKRKDLADIVTDLRLRGGS
jgi:hypothetical protein